MLKSILCLHFILLSCCFNIIAQDSTNDTLSEPEEAPFNIRREIRDANRNLKTGDIYTAADIFKKILKYAPERVDLVFEMANTYRFARDYENAAIWYLKADSLNAKDYPLSTYYAGLMLKMNDNCEAAIKYFEQFYKKPSGDFSAKYRKWAKTEIEGCALAEELKKKPLSIEITHLDSTINSPYTEISPFLWDDSTLVFASLPSDSVIVIEDQAEEIDYYIKFYEAQKKDGKYLKPEIFPLFQEEEVHTSNGNLSPDRKRFYFTKCYESFTGKTICSIFESKLFRGEWTTARALPDQINPGNSNSTQPYIAKHKSGKEILYFISDRLGGEGGKDIWFSEIKSNGEYGEVQNAGGRINTDRDEATPFFDEQTETLYFSSNGHAGMGGYDVFLSKGEGFRWNDPKNIGYPVNSTTDEMYYRLNEHDRSTGYLVSNRPGVISIMNATCCDDIFEFEYFDDKVRYVKGFVFEEGATKKKIINQARIELLVKDTIPESNTETVLAADTIENGFPYFFEITADSKYTIVASREGFLSTSLDFNTINAESSDTFQVDIYLKRFEKDKAYALKNIYYDYDKWQMRESSKKTLDTLYHVMIDNPGIIVEIGSHTDIRGTESYNYRLSQKRAENCVQYLIDKGISIGRVLARGYGESQLLREDCAELEECPEEGEGDCPCHQKNRRTEFKIVGELDVELQNMDKRNKK
ncbi:MAG: OmpA family protein [Chitinophagales bacterium]